MGHTRSAQLRTLVSFLAYCAVAFGFLFLLLYKGSGLPNIAGDDAFKARVLVPTSSSLAVGARVTASGVEVGEVTKVERADLGTRVDVEITDDAVLPLPQDTAVQLRQRTPIGENYLDLQPGRAKTDLPDGGTLGIDNAEEYVDVDQVLSTLRGRTRETARQTIRSLGGTLDGRGDELNDTLGAVNDFAPHGGDIVRILHRDRDAAARLVAQLGDVAQSIGDRGTAIDTIASRGLVGMRALRDRDAALAESLNELPATLTDVKAIVDTIGPTTDRALPVARNLTAAVTDLRPVVGELAPAATTGRGVLTALGGAAPGLRGVLDAATQTSKVLPAALPPLRKTFCQVHPMVRYIDPYMPEALHILMGLGSASNAYDATGHTIRLAPIFGPNSESGLPDEMLEAQSALLHSGLIGQAGGNALNYDPYPAPGELGTTRAQGSEPIGPERVDDSGYKYPRIKADC